ncbi:exodeoxyribonuclease 7 large subunit [Peptoclostridium acidaminophilum DSM 3953]|uniref:Exodeoxyribonuclease 7 large subunit n=2 Tax=Peptoclostridium acidaminophilum TaxID=1731 RepID=W8T404_PEPAC|nr:exodeoxyribonuclease 7 large subunit [Peptoclostridium acidaminophilum DSM 3953]
MKAGMKRMKLRALSVSHVNSYIKKLTSNDPILCNIRVKGEISNFKAHASGNIYFSLKDEDSKLRCVLFRDYACETAKKLEDGMSIIVGGSISLYEKDGLLQMYARTVEVEGVGELYAKFLRLKDTLEKEGIFDASRKKAIPEYPSRIGVITSESGAAVRDIINVIARRFPKVDIALYPVAVQGEGSAGQMIKGLEILNQLGGIDVIILGRGGGSIEELWSFNDEALARAIAGSNVPVISAVGHETDFTISDFAADMRAPTPSAAAEISVPSLLEINYRLEGIKNKIYGEMKSLMDSKKAELARIEESSIFRRPHSLLDERMIALDAAFTCINSNVQRKVAGMSDNIELTGRNLFNLNPLSILSRGYAIVQKDNLLAGSVSCLSEGEAVSVRFSDGTAQCTVDKITRD